ncbi:MAG TPA: hypothetical protein VE982_02780 [Gaiellaceae bacterium]|nr:hypothetical protein [Gaiellaceae bacterium]
MRPLLTLGFFLATAAVAAAAPSPRPARAPATLHADVAEWSVVPSAGVVAHGSLRIVVRNLGEVAHQLSLVRTSSFDPLFALSGSRAAIRPLATTRMLEPGETTSLTVSVRPGSYELVDNLPWHYWLGTSAAFSVR